MRALLSGWVPKPQIRSLPARFLVSGSRSTLTSKLGLSRRALIRPFGLISEILGNEQGKIRGTAIANVSEFADDLAGRFAISLERHRNPAVQGWGCVLSEIDQSRADIELFLTGAPTTARIITYTKDTRWPRPTRDSCGIADRRRAPSAPGNARAVPTLRGSQIIRRSSRN